MIFAGNRNYSLLVVVPELPCFTLPSGMRRARAHLLAAMQARNYEMSGAAIARSAV